MSRTPLLAPSDQGDAGTYAVEGDPGLEATSFVPIEEYSPLGYNVSFFNATLLNTSAMVNPPAPCYEIPVTSEYYGRLGPGYSQLQA
jgi:hypothetical protein